MSVAPAAWTRRRLRHCLTIDPSVPADVRDKPDLTVSFLPMEAVGEQGSLDLAREIEVGDAVAGYTFVADGDVVVAKVTPCFENGKGAVASGLKNGFGFATTEVYTLRSGPELDAHFLDYLLRSTAFRQYGTARLTGAGGLKRLSANDLRDYCVMLPTAFEQRAIADFLDRETARIDTLIADQQRLVELLVERRGSVADRLLVHAVDACPLKRVVGDVTVGIVVNPAAWYVENGVPALRGLNVRPGQVVPADLVYLSAEGDAQHEKSRLHAGDVVVVRTGQAGAAAVVPPELDGANAIDLLIVRPGPQIDSDFLAAYLNAPSIRSRVTRGSVGAIQGHFNVGALRELMFPAIGIGEQRDCAARWLDQAQAIDTLIAETERFIELSRERRAALITAAVTGQIDVRGEAA